MSNPTSPNDFPESATAVTLPTLSGLSTIPSTSSTSDAVQVGINDDRSGIGSADPKLSHPSALKKLSSSSISLVDINSPKNMNEMTSPTLKRRSSTNRPIDDIEEDDGALAAAQGLAEIAIEQTRVNDTAAAVVTNRNISGSHNLTNSGSGKSNSLIGTDRDHHVRFHTSASAEVQPVLSAFMASPTSQLSRSLSKQPLTELVWENLTIKAKPKHKGEQPKLLLNNITGKLSYGLTALMGPSGSGKSTLLNSLACRLDVNTIQEGDIYLNGEVYSNAELKRIAGYVMQDDLLNGYLTVFETLHYAAKLRLPSDWIEQQKIERVNEVIYEMGLDICRDVLIGNSEMKGISGGQKRRVCVGMQLLTRPQLLFLDEPTSGLDSVTAYELMLTLYNLSHTEPGCTIVASIHQPQSKIFDLFNHVILLKSGRVIYEGRRSAIMQTFTDAGFPCPQFTNPADHIMDVITTTNKTTKEEELAVEEALAAVCGINLLTTSAGRPKNYAKVISETEYAKNRLPWHLQTSVLFQRGLQEQWRKRYITVTSLVQSLIMAVLIGTAFLNIGTAQSSVNKRQSVLFFCVVNQGMFGALAIINSFPSERSLTLRERASGTYYVSAYFMAKVGSDTLPQFFVPLLFSFIVYWLVGFQNTVGKFFIFLAFMVLCSFTATSLALMVSAISRTIDLSVTILPLVLEISRLFGGFFLSPAALPKYFSWLDALSYIKYTYVGISLNELDGLVYDCSNPSTQICSGQQEITALGLDFISIGGCAGVLIGMIIFTRFIAFLAVRELKA